MRPLVIPTIFVLGRVVGNYRLNPMFRISIAAILWLIVLAALNFAASAISIISSEKVISPSSRYRLDAVV